MDHSKGSGFPLTSYPLFFLKFLCFTESFNILPCMTTSSFLYYNPRDGQPPNQQLIANRFRYSDHSYKPFCLYFNKILQNQCCSCTSHFSLHTEASNTD